MPGIFVGALAILVAYLLASFPVPAPAIAPWVMAGGTTLLLTSLMLLGASRKGRRPPALLVAGIGFVGLMLLVGFGAALLLPPESAASPLWLGLPRRAAILVYGVGLLPVLVVPVVYALSFEATVLSDAELSQLRSRLAAARAEAAAK